MKNIFLKVSYDGTNYCGWQKQNNAVSIQQTLEKAISNITREDIELIASGRTDSGVHALGQICNFKTGSNIPSQKFAYAINSKLPKDIRVIESKEVDFAFNARFTAKKKTYMYRIYNSEISSPFYYKYSMQVAQKLDMDLMSKNVKMLIGTYDWTSFYTYETNNPKNPVRTIYSADILKDSDMITFEIEGNGFLYNMVRIIVGTLIDIGLNKNERDIKRIIEKKDRSYAGATAKPQGLFLKEVCYQ